MAVQRALRRGAKERAALQLKAEQAGFAPAAHARCQHRSVVLSETMTSSPARPARSGGNRPIPASGKHPAIVNEG